MSTGSARRRSRQAPRARRRPCACTETPDRGWTGRSWWPGSARSEFVERMWRHYDAGTRRTVLKLYRATDARRMVPGSPATLAALDRPALVVFGTHDAYIPLRYAAKHREAFPSARFVAMPRSGHFP